MPDKCYTHVFDFSFDTSFFQTSLTFAAFERQSCAHCGEDAADNRP